ncbi:MAG: hypothetical protein K0S24_722 [Sphingobacterium sp.]|jgi:hypothetical protein|nr:hypothetical protein [Sphingobacterium sp.]
MPKKIVIPSKKSHFDGEHIMFKKLENNELNRDSNDMNT